MQLLYLQEYITPASFTSLLVAIHGANSWKWGHCKHQTYWHGVP